MKIIVDANIVFSTILNVNSRIGYLIINSVDFFDFIVPEFLRFELQKHRPRILKITGFSEPQLDEIQFQLFGHLNFFPESLIEPDVWR